jgi:hypothetical protein
MVDGKLYSLNGWLKKTKDGQPYLSLSFRAKDQKVERPAMVGAGERDFPF